MDSQRKWVKCLAVRSKEAAGNSEQDHKVEDTARGNGFRCAGLLGGLCDGAGCGEICDRVACSAWRGNARCGGLVLKEDGAQGARCGWGGAG